MALQSHNNTSLSIFITGAVHTETIPAEALPIAEKLGSALAQKNITTLVHQYEGFPLWVQKGAAGQLGPIILFSPAAHKDEHTNVYRLPAHPHITATIYTGFGAVGAELIGIRSADAVIVGCGEVAYMHALTTAMYEEKPIGILEGSWETTDTVKSILQKSAYKHDAVFYDTDPHRLIERIEAYLRK